MKKTILTILSILVLGAGNTFAARIRVHIGAGDGCPLDFGICIMFLSNTSPHNVELNGATLVVAIDANTLEREQPEAVQFLKSKSSGVFKKGFTVPADVSKALGINGNIIIDPGKVSISYAKGVYSLTVPHHINKPMIQK